MNNLFSKTRLRLTALYIIITVILLFIFSQIIYISVSGNIRNDVEGDFISKEQQIIFVQKQINNLKISLAVSNIIVLIIVSGTGYFLAGKTLEPVKRTMENQKQFLSDASHELRTPLSILQTNLENDLKEKRINNKVSKNILNNLEEVERMTALVNDLLLLSRLDANTSSISLKKIDLKEILQNIGQRFLPYAKSKKISLTFSLRSSKIFINGNQELLLMALGNVLKNAIDYNRKNGKVLLSLEKKHNNIIVLIKDTGSGIPSKNLPYVFDRFYKAEESRSGHKGTGLGLAITKDIIKKHKGSIKIKSIPGKQTTVTIAFPVV
ncbi:HAMP domain-containing histidine kinase [Patescibacteria group bacterium]|nr:HAMP domain-containing histidine kinase [Patescibacteria group bacterium]